MEPTPKSPSDVVLPEWAAQAIGNGSVRLALPWRVADLTDGDTLAGEVVGRTKCTLTVRAESGSYRGEPVEAGSWWTLDFSQTGVLKQWVARDNPQVGTRVVVSFRGRVGGGNRPRRDFVCAVFHEPDGWA